MPSLREIADALLLPGETAPADPALGKLAELLRANGIDPDDIGKVKTVRVGTYQGLAKDADGVIQVKDLETASIVFSPAWETGPQWPVVQPAAPITIVPPPAKKLRQPSDWQTAVILPDPQIGFRQFEDGTLDPFHDDRAMDVAIQIVAALEDDRGVQQVVNLGDFLDLPAFGKYEQEATFASTTQLAIDRGHKFLAEQRAAAPSSKIVVLEGNHDRRMQRFITNNALASFGLRQANAPDSWPVMSLPFLLHMDALDIEYIDAWPAGTWWVNDQLRAIHGDKVRSGGSTAAAYTQDTPHISTVFGHIHRQEVQSRTVFDRMGKIRSMAISPGCLCRVDGAVPSVHGSVGLDGRPATVYENWQQGVSVIYYKPEGQFYVDLVQIDDGFTVYQGQEFRSRVS